MARPRYDHCLGSAERLGNFGAKIASRPHFRVPPDHEPTGAERFGERPDTAPILPRIGNEDVSQSHPLPGAASFLPK